MMQEEKMTWKSAIVKIAVTSPPDWLEIWRLSPSGNGAHL